MRGHCPERVHPSQPRPLRAGGSRFRTEVPGVFHSAAVTVKMGNLGNRMRVRGSSSSPGQQSRGQKQMERLGGGGGRAVPSHSCGRPCPKGSCREVDSRLKIWKHQHRLKWFSLCSATFWFGEGPGTSPWRSGLSPPPLLGMEVGRKHSARSPAVLGPCPALNRVPGKQRHRPPAPSTSHPCVPRITLFPSRGLVRTPELCGLPAGSLRVAVCPLRADPSA